MLSALNGLNAPQGADGTLNPTIENGFYLPDDRDGGLDHLDDNASVRFACLNCSGLAGKMHLIKRIVSEHNLDFIYLSETWLAPGAGRRLSQSLVVSQEYARQGTGRYHYGQALFINGSKARATEFEIVYEDKEKHLLVFEYAGVRFVCLYIPPSRPGEFCGEILQTVEELVAIEGPCIMMGDLNARHVQFNDHCSNAYGTDLLDFCRRTGIERIAPQKGQWTFLTPGHQSIVDHVLGNEAALRFGAWCTIEEDLFVGTAEHCLLQGGLIRPVRAQPGGGQAPRPWNRRKLHDPTVRARYAERLNDGFDQLINDLDDISADDSSAIQARADCLYDRFMLWINDALEHEVGRVQRRERPEDFMTGDLAIKEGRLEAARRALLRLPPEDQSSMIARLDYEEAKKALEVQIQRRKEEKFRQFAEGLQVLELPEQLRLMHSIKISRTRSNGGLLRTDPRSLGAYGDHFRRQYSNQNPRPFGPEDGPHHSDQICPSPFCPETIRKHLKEAPSGKATGNSGLPMEALKAAGEVVEIPLFLLFSFFWQNAVVPKAWRVARIQPVPKKGDLTQIGNYRPISLTDVLRRLFESTLLGMVTASIGCLSIEQGGFRSKRGTIDQIAVLQEWIIQCKAVRKDRYMAFLDIKAAYDQVDRKILWTKLALKGVADNLIDVLKALFDGNASTVAVDGIQSPEFPLESGLLQGSPISPVLYSAFIDDLVADLNEMRGEEKMVIGGRMFRCLLYADDIVLLSTSESDLHRLLALCEDHAARNRYKFGVRKCEIVSSRALTMPAKLYEESLTVSSTFTYLGVPVTANGIDWNCHINQMGTKALASAHFFQSVGCNGGGFDLTTSLRIFKSFVRPMVEYCLCLCPLRFSKLVDRWYGRCLKVMTTMPRSTSHVTIGMFSELHPARLRMKKLAFKFAVRSRGRGSDFAIHFAFEAFRRKPLKKSTFYELASNEIVTRRDAARNRALFERVEPVLPKVEDILDEMLQEDLTKLSSSFIFQRTTHGSRKAWRKNFALLSRVDQRQILLWVCNLSAGRWKVCRHCGHVGATKHHLEECVYRGMRRPTGGSPSWTEDRLAEAADPIRLAGVVRWIVAMVGSHPTDGRHRVPP